MDEARLYKEIAMCCFNVPVAAAGEGQRDRRWCRGTPLLTWNQKVDSSIPTSPDISKTRLPKNNIAFLRKIYKQHLEESTDGIKSYLQTEWPFPDHVYFSPPIRTGQTSRLRFKVFESLHEFCCDSNIMQSSSVVLYFKGTNLLFSPLEQEDYWKSVNALTSLYKVH